MFVYLLFVVLSFTAQISYGADYYEAPPRVAVESLPVEEQNLYAATGTIDCKGYGPFSRYNFIGSAQLTLKNDVITTVGHLIFDLSNWRCVQRSKAENCKFIIQSHGSRREFPVEKMIGTGTTCPGDRALENDWAVMKLKIPVDDIEPYPIDPEKIRHLYLLDRVLTIGHSIDFNSQGQNKIGPKHFGECTILRAYGDKYPEAVSTACGCSEGCSGGSLLSTDPKPILLGVWVSSLETPPEARKAAARGKPNLLHWKKEGDGSYYVLITNGFLKALQVAGEGSQ
jgi:hypothetical protein